MLLPDVIWLCILSSETSYLSNVIVNLLIDGGKECAKLATTRAGRSVFWRATLGRGQQQAVILGIIVKSFMTHSCACHILSFLRWDQPALLNALRLCNLVVATGNIPILFWFASRKWLRRRVTSTIGLHQCWILLLLLLFLLLSDTGKKFACWLLDASSFLIGASKDLCVALLLNNLGLLFGLGHFNIRQWHDFA